MITAAADGSSLSNPGPAGWAWYVSDDCWAAGGWRHGTNNMGELMAVLDLLRQTRGLADDLTVLCDSQYAIKCCTEWLPGWKRRGWKKADGKPVLNQELLRELDHELAGRQVRFRWVKGHAGHPLNEKADDRARAAATAYRDGAEVDTGPGFEPASERSGSLAVVPDRRNVPEPDLFSAEPAAPPPRPGAAPRPADPSGPDPVEMLLVGLEQRLWTDEVRLDRDAMADLLHPAYVGYEASGQIRTRGSLLARAATLEGRAEVETLGVDVLGDEVVLVRSRVRREGEQLLCASVWQRVDGAWRVRFRQATPA